MRLDIEFVHRSEDHPAGKTIRRNSGQFSSERDAEIYGLSARPEEANEVRIWKGGVLRKTLSLQSKAP